MGWDKQGQLGTPECPGKNVRNTRHSDEVPHEMPAEAGVWMEKPCFSWYFLSTHPVLGSGDALQNKSDGALPSEETMPVASWSLAMALRSQLRE